MIQTIRTLTYMSCTIGLMHDAGAYWYVAETEDGEFIANCDSVEEAKGEIDGYLGI